PFWESAGLWAHAQIERRSNKRIVQPMVAGAVIAMRDVMSREHWIDPGEYSEEFQRNLVLKANALLEAEQEKQR
ncbi:secretion/conjugation apparatus DotM-related subunit, partial [Klebsiella pneumoniae]